jgi:dolichyl-phosphate beta-glucosyltransferase
MSAFSKVEPYHTGVKNVEISLIIPAYRAAKTIKAAIENVVEILESIGVTYEIIVVIDGDVDNTASALKHVTNPYLHHITLERNIGKGYALRTGIAQAVGSKYIGYIDADLDLSAESLRFAYQVLESQRNTTIVVGSKLHSESVVVYPVLRKVQSQIFARLIRSIFQLEVLDTQTGLKLGRSYVMKAVSASSVMDGFAFDLEILMRSKKQGAGISEVPITLNYKFESTISARKYIQTIWDVLRVFRLSL